MARNVEIKARIEDIDSILPKVAALADHGPIEIVQDDTFFICEQGRLKLRAFSSGEGQLIFYQRADRQGPRVSFYVVSNTSSPETLRECLALAYGQLGCVHKKRILYLVGKTRIHLDRVDGLGDFVELEVVLGEGESIESGENTARDFMQKLNIQADQIIEKAYIDLLSAAGRPGNSPDL
jgi:predicted adenylyl cyclase CyaB